MDGRLLALVLLAAGYALLRYRFRLGPTRSESPDGPRRKLTDVAELRRGRLEADGMLSELVEPERLTVPWQAQALLNGTERRVFGLLKDRATNLTVLAKVKLSDVVLPNARPYTSEWQREFNRAGQKHLDFVLVGRDWMPKLCVEVDGAEHSRTKQRERDQTKDSVLASAAIPMLRLDAGWNSARMSGEIDTWLGRLNLKKSQPQAGSISD